MAALWIAKATDKFPAIGRGIRRRARLSSSDLRDGGEKRAHVKVLAARSITAL
jgi:hypothetical protein